MIKDKKGKGCLGHLTRNEELERIRAIWRTASNKYYAKNRVKILEKHAKKLRDLKEK